MPLAIYGISDNCAVNAQTKETASLYNLLLMQAIYASITEAFAEVQERKLTVL